MSTQNFSDRLYEFKGRVVKIFLPNGQNAEGTLLDITDLHVALGVDAQVVYYVRGSIQGFSISTKSTESTTANALSLGMFQQLYDELSQLKYEWLTVTSNDGQKYKGFLSRVFEDHIVLIDKDSQLVVPFTTILEFQRGEIKEEKSSSEEKATNETDEKNEEDNNVKKKDSKQAEKKNDVEQSNRKSESSSKSRKESRHESGCGCGNNSNNKSDGSSKSRKESRHESGCDCGNNSNNKSDGSKKSRKESRHESGCDCGKNSNTKSEGSSKSRKEKKHESGCGCGNNSNNKFESSSKGRKENRHESSCGCGNNSNNKFESSSKGRKESRHESGCGCGNSSNHKFETSSRKKKQKRCESNFRYVSYSEPYFPVAKGNGIHKKEEKQPVVTSDEPNEVVNSNAMLVAQFSSLEKQAKRNLKYLAKNKTLSYEDRSNFQSQYSSLMKHARRQRKSKYYN